MSNFKAEQRHRDAANDFRRIMAERIMRAIKDEKAAATLGDDEGDESPLVQAFVRFERKHMSAGISPEAYERAPKHRYWGAGEPDCPREIKAGNGELHTMRCKICGLDNPRNPICHADQLFAGSPA